MGADESLNGYLTADRYTASNGLDRLSAGNHGHSAPCLPGKSGFLLL